jgi:hypothetical protein
MTYGPVNEQRLHFAAGPQARWRDASDEHTLWSVRSEQQSQRAAARRGAAAGEHLLRCRSSTMHSGIACVATPRIYPPGARAKVQTLFIDRP